MWPLMKICVALAATVFIGQVALLDKARQAYRDPISRYWDIMPGQSAERLKAYCQLHTGMKNNVEQGYCSFEAEDGIFGQVSVVESGHTIRQLVFAVQPNRLTLGDLLLCWGNPIYDVREYPETGAGNNLYWDNQFMAHIETAFYRKTDYFLPINYLSIEQEWRLVEVERLSCASRE